MVTHSRAVKMFTYLTIYSSINQSTPLPLLPHFYSSAFGNLYLQFMPEFSDDKEHPCVRSTIAAHRHILAGHSADLKTIIFVFYCHAEELKLFLCICIDKRVIRYVCIDVNSQRPHVDPSFPSIIRNIFEGHQVFSPFC